MTERISRQIVLAARPHGRVQLSDFRVEETMVPVPGVGQILLAVQYLSLDPYMRGRMDDRKSYAKPVQIGEVMVGESVATVIVSKSFWLCRGRHSRCANRMAYTLSVGRHGPS
jgi:NADPH-dependent curcumin reductase CurA